MPPQQPRSEATLERILAAAEDMLTDRSFNEASIAKIVKRAKSSIGSFYARFPNKEALLEHMIDRYHEELLQALSGELLTREWQRKGLETRMQSYVSYLVEGVYRHRGIMRARLLRNLLHPQSVPVHQTRSINTYMDRIRAFFMETADDICHTDKSAALDFALEFLDSFIATHFLLTNDTLESFRAIERDRLIQDLTRMALCYLKD